MTDPEQTQPNAAEEPADPDRKPPPPLIPPRVESDSGDEQPEGEE